MIRKLKGDTESLYLGKSSDDQMLMKNKILLSVLLFKYPLPTL